MHSIHGGTMRYFIGNKDEFKKTESIEYYLKIETEKQIYSEDQLDIFAIKVHQHRQKLMNLLYDLRKNGKKIVGISAPAKGNTLLNFCKIDSKLLLSVTWNKPGPPWIARPFSKFFTTSATVEKFFSEP